ncbi:MAG TPA: Ig-like domain-containing protein [Terriglobales bacterium]|nr:Ig-like domain-containing protein [Terriglobales bacterium]
MKPNQARVPWLLTALIVIMPLTGCCGKFFRGSNDVVGLSASPGNTSIQPGNTQQFTATGTFGNGGTGDVTSQTKWTSSDPAVATITASGLATGVSFGATTITASCQCYEAKNTLTVSSQTVNLTSITVTPASPTISVGKTQQFTATANFSNNTTSVITGSSVWTSSDNTIATINSSGLATGVSAGNVTITATSGTVSGTTTLTVQ